MGKVPNEFVHVKYANENSAGNNNFYLNLTIGSLFVVLIYQLYRGMHKGGSKGAGKGSDKTPG